MGQRSTSAEVQTPASTTHSDRLRRWMLVLIAVATAIASTWPVAAHLTDHVIDGARVADPHHPDGWWPANIGADVLTTVWILNWVLHALITQPLHLFDANIFYPAPLALARSEHMFATDLFGILGALLGNPVLAHQLALISCIALSTWATAFAVLHWSHSLFGGVVAGITFGVSVFHQQEIFHLQSLGTCYFPLMLFTLERFATTGRRIWVVAAAATLTLEILSGQYLAYFALLTWAIAVIVSLVFQFISRPSRSAFVLHSVSLALATAVAGLITLPFALPYMAVSRLGELPDNALVVASLVPNAASMTAYLWPQPIGQHVSIPATAWILALLGIYGTIRTSHGRFVIALLITVGLAGALVSLGPTSHSLGMYQLCAAILPGFGTMRAPFRASVLVDLAVAILGGFGAAWLFTNFRRYGVAVALLLLGFTVASTWRGELALRRMRVGSDLPPVYAFLAACGEGDPVLEIPAYDILNGWRESERVFFSTFHWSPLLNGRSGYTPPLTSEIMQTANRIPDGDTLPQLRARTGLRWLVIHCDELDLASPAARLCRNPRKLNVPMRGTGRCGYSTLAAPNDCRGAGLLDAPALPIVSIGDESSRGTRIASIRHCAGFQ